ncbi:DDB1- and CUL4-associated factor 8-like [Paramacrobiotus metropolitanus]|uniref:DDB1- and CUL4-associated factor 8-like n=1 Tax=Paramacrobiotus metropolitanus TaxID=2943436 RepID=UPI002445CA53|nr:DDB1- and CUL4-associated factor 8-like [Paramacrobiotus metropolitanus]
MEVDQRKVDLPPTKEVEQPTPTGTEKPTTEIGHVQPTTQAGRTSPTSKVGQQMPTTEVGEKEVGNKQPTSLERQPTDTKSDAAVQLTKLSTGTEDSETKFLPLSNDSLIVTASRDGGVCLAELSMAGGRPKIRHLCRHHGACHKIDVRADAHYHILASGEDAVVNYIDVREAKARKCVVVRDSKSSKVPLYSIMSNPLNAHEFVVSGYGKYVRAYDMRKLDTDPSKCQPLLSLCPPLLQPKSNAVSVSSAVYNYNGSEILATYNDFHIFLFKNCADETVAAVDLQHYEGHRNNQTVKGVNFYGAKSEYVVSGSDCGRVFFWDKVTARIIHCLMADEIGAVNVLEPHPRDPSIRPRFGRPSTMGRRIWRSSFR